MQMQMHRMAHSLRLHLYHNKHNVNVDIDIDANLTYKQGFNLRFFVTN